jgi:hypothetical protein
MLSLPRLNSPEAMEPLGMLTPAIFLLIERHARHLVEADQVVVAGQGILHTAIPVQ